MGEGGQMFSQFLKKGEGMTQELKVTWFDLCPREDTGAHFKRNKLQASEGQLGDLGKSARLCPHWSCQANLISFFDQVTNLLDSGNVVYISYLDFRKAFDRVSHNALMHKQKDSRTLG